MGEQPYPIEVQMADGVFSCLGYVEGHTKPEAVRADGAVIEQAVDVRIYVVSDGEIRQHDGTCASAPPGMYSLTKEALRCHGSAS